MFLRLDDLNGRAIAFPGKLIGMHAIFAPEVSRLLAVILKDGNRQYIMYLTQTEDHVAIDVEAIDRDHPLFGGNPN